MVAKLTLLYTRMMVDNITTASCAWQTLWHAKKNVCFPVALFFLSLAVHLLPFFLYGAHPLGYDTGFYRRYLIQPFIAFPNAAVPGLGDDALVPRLIFDLLRLLHTPSDLILYGSYILIFALLPIALYFLLRPRLGTRGAFIGGLLLLFSPVAYSAYSYMLWKNAWALLLLLLAYLCFEKRLFVPLIVLDIAIALSHKTTALVYLLSFAFLFFKGRRGEIFAHIAVAGLCFALVNTTLPHTIALSMPVAVFLDWSDYLRLSLPLLFAALFCGKTIREKEIAPPIIVLFIIGAAFSLLHLPFYERIFIFSDIALIALAAYGIETLLEAFSERPKTDGRSSTSSVVKHVSLAMRVVMLMQKLSFFRQFSDDLKSLAAFATIAVIVGLQLGNLSSQVRNLRPLVSETTVTEIEAIGKILPHDATVLTSASEAPWYEGWTLAHVAAPGMLRDRHNLEAWEALWATSSPSAKAAFLKSFPRPLYLSSFDDIGTIIGTLPPCLQKITPELYKDECR